MKKFIDITSIDQLKEGDIVVTNNHYIRQKVLGVHKYCVHLSYSDKHDSHYGILALDDLIGFQLEVDEPDWKPKVEEDYYLPDLLYPQLYDSYCWRDDPVHSHRLAHGLVFKTKEEAIAKAKKLLEK